MIEVIFTGFCLGNIVLAGYYEYFKDNKLENRLERNMYLILAVLSLLIKNI